MRAAILILLFSSYVSTFGQITWSDFESFTRYTEKHGLSTSQVYNIVEDNAGFLWIGSKKGISRFDGSTFVNYQFYYVDGKPNKIGDVLDLVIDHKGEYLYITSRFGVLMTSLKEIKFKHIKSFYPTIDFEIGNCISLYLDDESSLWVGLVGKGLLKIALNGKDHKQIQFKTIDKSKTEFESLYLINKITPDNQNASILWIGSSEGLIEFNKITETYKIHYYNNNQELFQRYISQLLPIDDKIYIGTDGVNWYIFDKTNKNSYQIIAEDSELYHFDITGLHQDDNDNIWITSPEGLVQYNTKLEAIINGASNNSKKGIIRGITLVDSRGIIWFTGGHGLYKYNPNSSARFIEIEKKNDVEFPTPISSIIQVGEYYYVCPPHGLNIYKINAKDFSFSIIPVLPLRQNRYYELRDMVKMHDDKLLVLGNQKAFILDTNSENFTEPPIQVPDISTIFLRCVAVDKNENYWVGTNKNGLYKFNYDSLTFKKYKDQFKGKTARDHIFIKKLFVDSQNKLWIGQASTTVMNLDDNTLKCLNPEFDYEIPLPFGGFAEDDYNRIWVANTFDGIGYVDQNNINGGINKVVEGSFSGIYNYNDSLLWTIGEEKLGILNTKHFNHHLSNIGFETNFTGPVLALDDGNYMIGCENGVLIYNPETHRLNQEFPKAYIQEVKANNEQVYYGGDENKKTFALARGTKSLSIKISALAFQNPEAISYQYKTDDSWIDLGASKEINLTNLRQGDYALELKAVNSLGNSSEPSSYSFKVKPYWYTTNVALLFYTLLLGGIVYALYKFNLNRKLTLAESFRIKEIDALKSKMYANISHEFRTPLTIIRGLSGMLLKKTEDNKDKELIKGIDNSNDQLLNLVNQMLDLTSLDANKMTVHYKNGDVIEFIKKSVDLYRSYTDSKLLGLEFITNVEELKMDFDDDKLQKILNNLLSNAIKFTPHEGKISVSATQQDKNLQIVVSDTGKGIKKKDLPLVFDRYYKTNDNQGREGTGIGLSLTKELVELLGGTIEVKSKKNKGTMFIVDLPITDRAPEADIAYHLPFVEKGITTSIDKEPLEVTKGHQNILLVEDNQEIQNFVAIMLSSNYNIITADNGLQGLEITREQDIDFIISDVMMPKMDGFEFCKNIKSHVATSHIPFIMVSARTHTKDKQHAYQLGVDAYLTKPFNPEELKLIIDNLIRKQKERKQHLLQLLSIKQPEIESLSINKLDLDLVNELQTIILNTTSKLYADEIAKQLLVSRTQLHRKVKSLTGKSLTHYANHVRIEKAKHLLRTSELHVKEIGYSIGFESSTYFIRLFKNEVGVTPDAYRSTAL